MLLNMIKIRQKIKQLLSKIGRKDNIVVMDFKVLVSISQETLKEKKTNQNSACY